MKTFLRLPHAVLACAVSLTCAPLVASAQEATAQLTLPPIPEDLALQFGAIGRVNKTGFKTKGNCTGTLIRPDVVLTAAHCATYLPRTELKRVFVAGWRRGNYIAYSDIETQEPHPAYLAAKRHDPRFDVGLLFLENPITDVAPFPLAPDKGESVAIVGYHFAIPHVVTGRLDCPVLQRDDTLMWINCPVVSGNSGGPVLEPDGAGGWHVTGVISSTRGAGKGALATRIPEWVHETLKSR